mmetsp:Transcript_73142/g.211741  ORF Transcript_73142/g.211741 Transcript_73142/m.211741 type:complete len:225 (+) Transcript_73142:432-1106(+)
MRPQAARTSSSRCAMGSKLEASGAEDTACNCSTIRVLCLDACNRSAKPCCIGLRSSSNTTIVRSLVSSKLRSTGSKPTADAVCNVRNPCAVLCVSSSRCCKIGCELDAAACSSNCRICAAPTSLSREAQASFRSRMLASNDAAISTLTFSIAQSCNSCNRLGSDSPSSAKRAFMAQHSALFASTPRAMAAIISLPPSDCCVSRNAKRSRSLKRSKAEAICWADS